MSRGERTHQEDRVQRRPRGWFAGALLGSHYREFFALNDGPRDRGVEERREHKDARAHRSACADLVNLPADSIDLANLMWAVCLARYVRKKEAIPLRRGNADQSTSYFQSPRVRSVAEKHHKCAVNDGRMKVAIALSKVRSAMSFVSYFVGPLFVTW